jgi:hypothetical protein
MTERPFILVLLIFTVILFIALAFVGSTSCAWDPMNVSKKFKGHDWNRDLSVKQDRFASVSINHIIILHNFMTLVSAKFKLPKKDLPFPSNSNLFKPALFKPSKEKWGENR